MSGKPTELEKFVEDIFKKLMDDKPLFEGVQT
jgi:hypothetical protein